MNGLPYYKAYPRDFLDGTAGMDFEVKGAYRILLDLIYLHGGRLVDDPRFIAGHLGCSVKKWNGLRAAVIATGKIVVSGGYLGNLRADKELDSLKSFSDKQRENASHPRKNKGLAQATAKPKASHTESDTEADKQQPREAVSPDSEVDNSTAKAESGLDKKPGAVRESAGAALQPGAVRVAAQPEARAERADRRVKLLSAMGVGPDGISGPSRFIGTEADMAEADKWAALGLSVDDQCRLISERMERMRRKNPRFAVGSFAYFTGAMADLAAARSAPVPTGTAKGQSEREAKMARYAKIAGQGAA